MQIVLTRLGQGLRMSALGLTAALALGLASFAQAAESADEFLKQYGERALSELTQPGLSESELEQRFKELLDQGFDVPAIGQFVVARYWRSADEQQRAAFLEVFREYLAQRFLPVFRDYKGGDFKTRAPKPTDREGLVWVPLQLDRQGGDTVTTEWLLRRDDGSYRILDIKAEGTSMAITLRDEYASVIRREGGIEGLIKEMRRLLDQGAFTPKG